ncbi:nucleotidyltransferase [Clostridium sp. Marseille-Q2269]|uniref:nucleotidyltransferase n=1 Tax=Clostridium sp. Marseille-Q2269 TaxID=2942205 RepID=UPI0020732802|nr:nucleotidyltransferase [Clostridium sp. Marseille-Q2269]
MNISSIIVEYNPMHKGHIYHIEKTKELTGCDALICIMSGNFVQRGFPSILDKWTKANIAISNGVDLVLELPALYSLSSAEFFSFGAISILNNLNIVNNICFGSEIGSIENLQSIANILLYEPFEYKILLKKFLNNGVSFAKARNLALVELNKNNKIINEDINKILSLSNNILGIEYLKSLLLVNSSIKPFTITRQGANYKDENLHNQYSSASSIRKYLKENENIDILKTFLPEMTFLELKNLVDSGYDFSMEDSMINYIRYKYTCGYRNIHNLIDVSEGLDNRIYKSLENNSSYHNLIGKIKSKRYAYSRIGRILCQYFIGFENYDLNTLLKSTPSYIRVLASNETGLKVLKEIKKHSSTDIYTKIPKYTNDLLALDIKSTNAYSILNNNIKFNEDYFRTPTIIKNKLIM